MTDHERHENNVGCEARLEVTVCWLGTAGRWLGRYSPTYAANE